MLNNSVTSLLSTSTPTSTAHHKDAGRNKEDAEEFARFFSQAEDEKPAARVPDDQGRNVETHDTSDTPEVQTGTEKDDAAAETPEFGVSQPQETQPQETPLPTGDLRTTTDAVTKSPEISAPKSGSDNTATSLLAPTKTDEIPLAESRTEVEKSAPQTTPKEALFLGTQFSSGLQRGDKTDVLQQNQEGRTSQVSIPTSDMSVVGQDQRTIVQQDQGVDTSRPSIATSKLDQSSIVPPPSVPARAQQVDGQTAKSLTPEIANPSSTTDLASAGTQGVVSNLGTPRGQSAASVPTQRERANIAATADPVADPVSRTSTPQSAPLQTATISTNNTASDANQPTEAQIEWLAESELAFDPKTEPRAAITGTGTGTSRSDPVFQRPEIPRQVAAQLANVAHRINGNSVDLALNPEELGSVKLSLTAAENGIAVTIIAERGETLDLMRRNIDILAQEFRDIGYGDISFSFGQQSSENSGDSPNSNNQGWEQSESTRTTNAEAQQSYQITLSPADGIDIRV